MDNNIQTIFKDGNSEVVCMIKNSRDFQNLILLGKILKYYGFRIAFLSGLDTVARRLPFTNVYHKTHRARYSACKKYILKHYKAEIENQVLKYKNCKKESLEKLNDQYSVWVFWWQGIDNAPEIVKACIESIKLWAGDRNVIIISQENCKDYVEIPDYLTKKFYEGNISFAHFSDIIRLMLLSKYGGIWVDSTLVMTGDFPKIVEGYSFYTVKHKTDEGWHISDGSWATYFLACTPNDPTITFCKDMHIAYWKKEPCIFCYLLFDCFLSIGYDLVPIIREEIDSVPVNNSGVYDLSYGHWRDLSDQNQVQEVLSRACIHKLTYKRKYMKEINHQETLYGMLMKYALKMEDETFEKDSCNY